MDEQPDIQSSSGRHALRAGHLRQSDPTLPVNDACDSTGDGSEQPRKLLIRELRKIINENSDSDMDVVRRIRDAALPQRPHWVFGTPKHIYYILDENGKGTPAWVDVEAILRVCFDDPNEAKHHRPKLGELWQLAKGRRLPPYPDPLAASSGGATGHEGGKHHSDDATRPSHGTVPTAHHVEAGLSVGERRTSLGTHMSTDVNVELERLTRALKKARDELSHEKFQHDTIEAAQAARIAGLQADLDHLRSTERIREQREQVWLEKHEFETKSGARAVDQLREELQHAKDSDRQSRDRHAHEVAMLVVYTGGFHRLKRPKKYGEVVAGLVWPGETEMLIDEPDIDRHGPATAMITRYVRTFLIIRYRVPGEQPDIPQEHIDRVVREGKLPSEVMLRMLLTHHAILRELFPQLLTVATTSEQEAANGVAKAERSELASLAELAYDTISILHSPRRQLGKQDPGTMVIPLSRTDPFIA